MKTLAETEGITLTKTNNGEYKWTIEWNQVVEKFVAIILRYRVLKQKVLQIRELLTIVLG